MSACSQPTITDKAFENLCGIHTLILQGCNQSTITEKAFENLRRDVAELLIDEFE